MTRLYKKGVHYSPDTEFKKGQQSPRFQPIGSRKKWGNYIRVKVAEHGHADSNWRFEHVIVMEQVLGRKLVSGEYVHHINCIKTDNRPENLYLCSNSGHGKTHSLEKLIQELLACGYINFNKMVGKYYVC